MLDVAIAGGGPGGLACAHALRRALKDVNVKVFERVPEYNKQGAVVMLQVNGLRAVQAIDPKLERHLREHAGPAVKSVIMDRNGTPFSSTLPSSFDDIGKQYGMKPFSLGWHEIRQVLYDNLPENVVQFGQEVIDVVDEGDHAQLTVEEGSGERSTVKARVVIGADGYYSAIREYCLQDGPPSFAGGINWRARVSRHTGQAKAADTSYWYLEDPAKPSFQNRLFLTIPISDTDMIWNAYAPASALAKHGLEFDHRSRAVRFSSLAGSSNEEGSEELRQRVLAAFSDYSADVLSVIGRTEAQLLTEHGLFLRAAEDIPDVWGKGNITLCGDAAHLTLPTGQGVNLAFEDAAVLGVKVSEGGLNQQVLRSYEAERAPRCREVLQQVQAGDNPDAMHIIRNFTLKSTQPITTEVPC